MAIVNSIIIVCKRLVGTKEKPGNSGFSNAVFERDMKLIGWYKGAPWCAFVVSFIMREVYCAAPKVLAVVKSTFTGGAMDTWSRAKKQSIFTTGTTPQVGAVVIFQHGNSQRGHVGIVQSFSDKDNVMHLYEGNTNASGSREGDSYLLKPRTIKREFRPDGLNVVGYIYPVEL